MTGAVALPTPDALPPLKAVQAALHKTTERLASELARPTTVAPDWSESEWLIARAAASMHGASSLLSRTLRWQGPTGWAQFLNEQKAHTAYRHARIQQMLALLDTRAREAGIAIVALKGAALYAMRYYELGERPMADLDLLVRQEDLARAASMIESLGFHRALVVWKHWVLEPNEGCAPASFGEHANNGIKIDLHGAVREMLPVRAVDITPLVFPLRTHPGINDYPSAAALLTHVLLHAAGAMVSRSLRIVHLQDISRISERMTNADWEEFLAPGPDNDYLWWAFPPLALTARYFPSIPQRALAATARACPGLLKQACARWMLSSVSYSHLRISAFPGIEWSRSVGEMLAYVRRRVAPGAEAVEAREHLARTHPGIGASEWGSLSQTRRILRWLKARPPRPETLSAVCRALAQPK